VRKKKARRVDRKKAVKKEGDEPSMRPSPGGPRNPTFARKKRKGGERGEVDKREEDKGSRREKEKRSCARA